MSKDVVVFFYAKIVRKLCLTLAILLLRFMLKCNHKEVILMFNIYNYIKDNEVLNSLDFITVYTVIIELCRDGKLKRDSNV